MVDVRPARAGKNFKKPYAPGAAKGPKKGVGGAAKTGWQLPG